MQGGLGNKAEKEIRNVKSEGCNTTRSEGSGDWDQEHRARIAYWYSAVRKETRQKISPTIEMPITSPPVFFVPRLLTVFHPHMHLRVCEAQAVIWNIERPDFHGV